MDLLQHDHDVLAIAFRPDGKLLASSTLDAAILFWDPAEGELQVPSALGVRGIRNCSLGVRRAMVPTMRCNRLLPCFRVWEPIGFRVLRASCRCLPPAYPRSPLLSVPVHQRCVGKVITKVITARILHLRRQRITVGVWGFRGLEVRAWGVRGGSPV